MSSSQNRQQLAELLRDARYTLWQITYKLDASGYRTRRGQDFQATIVFRLLLLPSVAPAGE